MLSWREAVDLVLELQHERSHVWAAVHGWDRPMGWPEMLAQAQLNVQVEKPLAWPWEHEPEREQVTAEELAELRAELRARSAIKN